MVYRLERNDLVESDLRSIVTFLVESALDFGRSEDDAERLVAAQIRAFLDGTKRLARAPYRGTLRPELGPGVRNLTMDRFILYFEINEAAKSVLILAVFYGGQDHTRRMLARMLR